MSFGFLLIGFYFQPSPIERTFKQSVGDGEDARAERPAAGRSSGGSRGLTHGRGCRSPETAPVGIRAGRLPRSSGPSSRACRLDKLARGLLVFDHIEAVAGLAYVVE